MTSSLRTRLTRISDTQRRRVGFAMIGLLVLVAIVDIAISVADTNAAGVAETLVLAVAFVVVLSISLRGQPRNGAVWTLLLAAFFGLLGQAGGSIGEVFSDYTFAAIESGDVTVAPSSIEPLAAIGFSAASTFWIPGAFLLAIHLLILFPDGKALTPRWRRIAWAAGAMIAIMAVAGLANTAPWVDTPYDEILADDLSPGLFGVLMMPLMAVALAAVVHLVRRYRASSGEERLQYRWVTWALAIYVVNIFTFGWLGSLGPLLSTLALANIAVAFGIAITRYGLYNIDIVVSRSITYGALAVFIAGVYVALVVGVGSVLGGDSSFGLSIAATVLVAIVFEPARRWVERRANRLVYGERATPYEVLVSFTRRSSELSDEELLERVPHLVVDGTGAATATLWLKTAAGFREAATWPEDTPSRRLESSGRFDDTEADYSLPVFHDGELLGGLSLTKSRGELITPAEEVLLQDLAAGMGLALRNAGLTGELRKQVADLEESRERILAAADAARRALERDLDSGPQQQLVALKVKLGPTRKRAEQLGAEKTATLLAQLEDNAGEAIQAVRDFAGGIYPPLLEAEGLAVAITEQANKAAFPVSVHGDGVGRHQRETEAAVYFAVMEALQNAAKYAEATSASVNLSVNDDRLEFEVRDDGRGFDTTAASTGSGLAGMADRLDTVGGELRLESVPGEGTVVTGSVPIGQFVSA
ncbi:ATP-binding protein [Actinomycetota bacterium]